MATIEGDEVLTKDRSTGRIHKRIQLTGTKELLTFEGDNLDVSGEFDIIESASDADESALCHRCFPDGPPVAQLR